MPKFVIKADKEHDLYVGWSTVVDAPTHWGTKEEMLHSTVKALDVGFINKFEYEQECQRYDRADETGTSFFTGEGGWGDQLWLRWSWVDGDLKETGSYFLPRDKLYEFLINEDNSVLRPIEDDD